MQALKKLTLAPRSLSALQLRRLSASSSVAVADDDLRNQVLVEGKASARAAILNRPSSLNALTNDMVVRLKRLYVSWEDNPDIGFLIFKGNGRAFCAGSDVVAHHNLIKEDRLEDCKDFFRNLYMFVYNLSTCLKPHVAILDGIVMGSGAGVLVPNIFRVATERTIFSNPEVHIGFHPDAGASFYLSRLPGHMGEYLALTGERLKGVDMIGTGLATHFATSDRVSWIDERLAKLVTDDPAVIDSSLAQCGDVVYPDKNSILHRLEVIDKCFCRDTIEEIIDALEKEASTSKENWCKSALKRLKEASPLSLKVTLRSIREGRFETLDECLAREYRMSLHAISKEVSSNFVEGVRAKLVDKDLAPKWDPPTLGHVSDEMVDWYFSPLDEFEPELKLPVHLREPFI